MGFFPQAQHLPACNGRDRFCLSTVTVTACSTGPIHKHILMHEESAVLSTHSQAGLARCQRNI